MSDELRVLLVGAGRMGQLHLEALAAARTATTAAVVEPAAAVRSQLAGSGIRCHADLAAAIDAGGFDAALIATPSDLHLDLVRELLVARVPILCEKPCGLSSAEARQAVELAAAAGVPLQVAYWRRFVPALRALRERILAGELGRLELIQAWQWDGEPPSLQFRLRSGGLACDMGVHEFDQIRWLTGGEIEVASAIASEVSGGEPDSVLVTARLSGGGTAVVSLGLHRRGGDACWAEVMGTRDWARIEFMVGTPAQRVFRQALVNQVDAFAGFVRGETAAGADGSDAVAAITAAERTAACLEVV